MVSSRFLGEGVPFVPAVFTVPLKVEPHWHLQGGSGGVARVHAMPPSMTATIFSMDKNFMETGSNTLAPIGEWRQQGFRQRVSFPIRSIYFIHNLYK